MPYSQRGRYFPRCSRERPPRLTVGAVLGRAEGVRFRLVDAVQCLREGGSVVAVDRSGGLDVAVATFDVGRVVVTADDRLLTRDSVADANFGIPAHRDVDSIGPTAGEQVAVVGAFGGNARLDVERAVRSHVV